MKSLANYVFEALNTKQISKDELNVIYDEFKKKYNVDLSKKNLKFFNLCKNEKQPKSVTYNIWITYMNDPNNNAKHIETYFCGVASIIDFRGKMTSSKFVEYSARTNNKISKKQKKLFNKNADDIIKELNIKNVSKDDLLSFINSLNESLLMEGALSDRINLNNKLEKDIKKSFELLGTLWENDINFNIEEYHIENKNLDDMYDEINAFYYRHLDTLQGYFPNEKLPGELNDIKDDNIFQEINNIILSAMLEAGEYIETEKKVRNVLFDSSKMKDINELYKFCGSISSDAEVENWDICIHDFKELADICKKQKGNSYFFVYDNNCIINFRKLVENIDKITDIVL